jgi:hypothetical protein
VRLEHSGLSLQAQHPVSAEGQQIDYRMSSTSSQLTETVMDADKKPGSIWHSIRKGSQDVYLAYGSAWASLEGKDLRFRSGPPGAVYVDLSGNLKGIPETGTMIDAQALADGGMEQLTAFTFLDEKRAKELAGHLAEFAGTDTPCELRIRLDREHIVRAIPKWDKSGLRFDVVKDEQITAEG